MPVKRRTTKQRSKNEIEAWGTVFETGWDFFQEVFLLTGLRDLPRHSRGSERDEARSEFLEAAEDAWQRLGANWLETYEGENEPWAVTEFGLPR